MVPIKFMWASRILKNTMYVKKLTLVNHIAQIVLNINIYTMINRAWNRSASFTLTQWLKIISHMIITCTCTCRLYYHCCCIIEAVIFSHCVHLKLGHWFHALLNVCCDYDDTVPLRRNLRKIYLVTISAHKLMWKTIHKGEKSHPFWQNQFLQT